MIILLVAKKLKTKTILFNNNKVSQITLLQIYPTFVINCTKIKKFYAVNVGYKINYLSEKKNKIANIYNTVLGGIYKNFIKIKLDTFNLKNTNNFFDIKMLQINNNIKISGHRIGKGFLGNIKEHNFKRGPMSHGSKHHRLQGSLGAGTTPGRTFPGKKMSKHHGPKSCTFSNLKILNLDYDNNILSVKGSIPGKNNKIITISTL